jgi:hypothetical protein
LRGRIAAAEIEQILIERQRQRNERG